MNILVACEESQAVTIELRKLGHEAYSCDIVPCSGGHPEWHLQQDVRPLLKQKWDMLIAFPPCTYLSNAGACRLYPKKGQIDPVSSKLFKMPKYTQEIQPWMFGHPYTKKTRLWLKGLHKLVPTNIVEPIAPYVPAGTGRKDRSKYGAAKRGEDARNRSKTFPGIAKAMAEQWAGNNKVWR